MYHIYYPNKHVTTIRSNYGEKEARTFLRGKSIVKTKNRRIRLGKLSKYIANQTYYANKMLVKFSYRNSSGKKDYDQLAFCFYCNQRDNAAVDYDHFLLCSLSKTIKDQKIDAFTRSTN